MKKMKKTLCTVMCLVLLLCSVPGKAEAATRDAVTPSLSFSGTTANCSVRINKMGKTISATMELWHGTTLVDSWSGTGSSRLILNGTHSNCVSGWTYTLKVRGTIGGTAFSEVSVMAIC